MQEHTFFGNTQLLRKKQQVIEEKNRLWYENIQDLIECLNSIPYAIIKGEPLSILAYGDTGFRSSNDIDILVSKVNLHELEIILHKCGFSLLIHDKNNNVRQLTRKERIIFANSHQTVPYYKYVENVNIKISLDINTSIFWAEYSGNQINILDFISDNIIINVYGIKVKTLSPLKTFIEVCLHHYKDMHAIYKFKFSNPFTTQKFQDIYFLYKRYIQNDINILKNYVFENNLESYIYYILYYTSKVFSDAILIEQLKLFETINGIVELNYYGLSNFEKRKWSIGFEKRLDNEDLYHYIEPYISSADIDKTNEVYSIYTD